MKKNFLLLSALIAAIPVSATFAQAELRPVEVVPAAGEYVVLISEKTAKRTDWKRAADKFLKRYSGKLVVWRGNDVLSAREELKKNAPRYVAVIAAPEEIDRVFVAKLHRMSREMNDDIFGDFLWGIISGKDGATAGNMLAGDVPRENGLRNRSRRSRQRARS